MIQIIERKSSEDPESLQLAYLSSLTAPIDGMWEAFAAMGLRREIRISERLAGFFCINEEGQLLQFHIQPEFERSASDIFDSVLARDEVQGAMVSTADPLFLGLCLDCQKSTRVHTYLYQDHSSDEVVFPGDSEARFDHAEADELSVLVERQRASLEQDPGDWLIGYLENLIARRELYVLRHEGQIVGTGEARVSDSQSPFADLGVITMLQHRGKGFAPHILSRLKRICYERQLVPICSTTVENLASQRAITRAGFVSRHRLLEIAF